jgi:nucleotide-binding universal stress UspA family protein
MTYATLLVHLECGQANAGLLQVAGDLAQTLEAAVIGVAACRPIQLAYDDGYVSGELIEEDRKAIERELKQAEAEFRGALEGRSAKLEWRSKVMYAPLSDYLIHEARCADLIVTGVGTASMLTAARRADTGDLVMQAGRPVLVVPAAARGLQLRRVVLAWKDTREARRAASDALPLLERAAQVTIVEVAAADELEAVRARLADVAGWLRRHGVAAEPLATLATGDDKLQLATIAREQRADVLVAGAYGHSRLREWVLGGVTRELLLRSDHCSLLSH